MTAFALALPDEVLDEIAARAARILQTHPTEEPASPYMNIGEAAEYMRCSKQRLYDLLSSRRLSKFKDGSRVLLSRAEIDAYLR